MTDPETIQQPEYVSREEFERRFGKPDPTNRGERWEAEGLEEIADEVGEKIGEPVSHTARARTTAARDWARAVLTSISSNLEAGREIHDEDRAALIADMFADVKVPSRHRVQLEEAAGRVIDRVVSGDLKSAREQAREQAWELGTELGASPAFKAPEIDRSEIGALVDRIRR